MDPKILVDETESYFIEQMFTCCLAEMAYYIESDKIAAIIDPMRDYQRYIDLAKSRNAEIKYIIETHFHADFVSGHLDLAKHTGATIIYGPTAAPNYKIHVAADGELIQIGKISLKVLHTPGHTPESSSYLLLDEKQTPKCVFSGDTLFLGDVGRPDLACSSTLTKEDLASQLYDSLQTKIIPLPRNITVYPAHGAGSSCGKNISDGTFDTLENQFKTNWALQEGLTKTEFVEKLVKISPPPQYYFYDAKVNREGYESLDDYLVHSDVALTPAQVKENIAAGVILIDGRSNNEFIQEFIPGSFFLSLGMPFAQWIGTLIKPTIKLMVLAPVGKEKEAILRLARIGYSNVLGYLEGGIESWKKAGFELDHSNEVTAEQFLEGLSTHGFYGIDVRKPDELINHGSVKDLPNYELTYLEESLNKNNDLFPRDKDIYIMCRSGQRSVVAISILKKFGYEKLINVGGGFIAVKATGNELVVSPE